MSGRDLHEKQRSFKMTSKIAINCNAPPQFDINAATLRCVDVLPFDMKARYDDPTRDEPYDSTDPTHIIRDDNLKGRLSPEALLAWAVAGAVKWYKVGLTNRPDCCQQCTNSVVAENDVIGNLADEHLVAADGRRLEFKAARVNITAPLMPP